MIKYDLDNTDISVAALLILGVVAVFGLSEASASTVLGTIIGFIGGVARAASKPTQEEV